MNADLKNTCTALIKRFIGLQYDGVSGINAKAGLIATERGSRDLLRSIARSRDQNILRKRNLRHADFNLVDVTVPEVPGSTIQVTAVESFQLEFGNDRGEAEYVVGRRGHSFDLVMGEDGGWIVDAYSTQTLEEKRAAPPRPAGITDLRKPKPPPREKEQSPASMRDQHRRAQIKKLAGLLFFIATMSGACLYLFGAHAWIDEVCLYTGRHRRTLDLMGRQILQRETVTDAAAWAEQHAPLKNGHYWQRDHGWKKELFGDRVLIQPTEQTLDAMETFRLIHIYSQHDEQDAVGYLKRYHIMIDQLILRLENAPGATTWEAIKDGLRQMRVEMSTRLGGVS